MNEFSDFYQAISKNREALVKRLLKEGERPDSEAVVCAIQHKAHDVLRLLIRAGADVDKPEAYWGYTPLIRAMHDRNETAFRMLLKAGADIDKRGQIWAPLHWAAKDGLPGFAKLCIAANAKVGLRDRSGNTPLMWAASMGHLEVVKLLLKAGANPLSLNRAGRTACQLAAENKETRIIRLLEPISQRKPPFRRGIVALIEAVSNQDMVAVEKYLAKGIDPNGTDRYGRSPMQKAISLNSIPLVKRLIAVGVDLNKFEQGGTIFLQSALNAEKLEIAKILLHAGARPNPPGQRDEDAAIRTACLVGDAAVVKLMLDKGANPRCSEAMVYAAHRKSAEKLKVLLAAGARLDDVDKDGWTPLFWVVFVPLPLSRTYRHVREFKKMKGVTFTPRPKPEQIEECIKLLIEHGADVNHADNKGRTPIMYAQWITTARRLIEAGARLDIRDKEGHNGRYWLKKNGVVLKWENAL